MALWRVLDKTSAALRGADKHPPPPKQNRINANRYYRRNRKNGKKNRSSRAGFQTLINRKKIERILCSIFYYVGGRGWIRTTESDADRFTVCSLWPLGNPSIAYCSVCVRDDCATVANVI